MNSFRSQNINQDFPGLKDENAQEFSLLENKKVERRSSKELK